MEQRLELKQTYTLSQKMIQSGRILQMNAMNLQDYLEAVSIDNPVIEIDLPAAYESMKRAADTDFRVDGVYEHNETLGEYIRAQIVRNLSTAEKMILMYITDSLDESGYFRETPAVAAAVLNTSIENVTAVLKEIHECEPAGAAAYDLKECLLLQAERKYHNPLLNELISRHLEEAARNHFERIGIKMNLQPKDVQDLYRLILTLNPRPGNAFQPPLPEAAINADLIIISDEGFLSAKLNEQYAVNIRINEDYIRLSKTAAEKTRVYLEDKIRRAHWIMECLEKRNETLMKLAQIILERHQSFFVSESPRSRLTMKEAAEAMDVHPSTVTRAVKNKYLECARGIFPLRTFFSAAGKEGISRAFIEAAIRRIISAEDPFFPLSDAQITHLLKEEGIDISRRAVSKIRLAMGYKDAAGRRRL